MRVICEIHKYELDDFQYIVTSTTKYSESKVKNEVDRMNYMVNESLKKMEIRYEFVVSDTSVTSYK